MSKVVITGIGIICSAGTGVEEFWNNICNGASGIRKSEKIDVSKLITSYAGEIKDDSFLDKLDENTKKNADITGKLAMFAVDEALAMAGIDLGKYDAYRTGTIVGTSLGGHWSGDKFHEQWLKDGFESADASLLKYYSLHATADVICQKYAVRGPKSIISTACSASATAIGYASDLIRNGKADIMIAGGTDPVSRLSFGGFNSLQALDNEPCSPYSKSHGITLGEGAGFLILEKEELAVERGAVILAELSSYAITSDAYHQTAPDLAGEGASRSMSHAIEKAGYQPDMISYINGHGTGTAANDNAEVKAIKTVFKDLAPNITVSSTKGGTGHCLGAAGAIEAVASVLAIKDNMLPPTINICEEKKKTDLDFVWEKGRKKECTAVLSNSFAFGGNNSTLLFSKYEKSEKKVEQKAKKRIVISGVGTLGCAGTNYEEFSTALKEGICQLETITEFDTGSYQSKSLGKCKTVEWKKYMPSSAVRRMDNITKMSLVSSKQAIDDAKLKVTRMNCDRVGIMYGTGSGPISTIEEINRTIILEGMDKVNPKTFPNSVINAAPGNVSITHRIKGPTSAIAAGGVSTLSAVAYAYEIIQNGDADQMLVVGADEAPEVMLAGHDKLELLAESQMKPFDTDGQGMILSEGSNSFILETYESAKERGAHIYCEVLGYGQTSDHSDLVDVSETGEEWEKSFQLALNSAGIKGEQVDLVVSAACGIQKIDKAEAQAIKGAFGTKTHVSAIESIIGHSMGSTGGFGILGAIYCMENSTIYPTLGLENPCEKGLNYVTKNIEQQVNYAAVSSFAFGGNYISLILGKAE